MCTRKSLAGAFVAALFAVLVAASVATAGPDLGHRASTRHAVLIQGTVYAFDNQARIAGATIRARGAPGATARSDSRGHYRLEVPAGRRVTPYVQADGYHGIFLQTFTMHRRNLRRVNFQIPTEGTYSALASLLDVKLDEDGNPRRCAIVSTVSTKAVRDLSFREFIAYGAHGVPGATAATTPALPDPVYFNDNVIPDRSLTETSTDGGVIWTEVPRGTYQVSARHPHKHFASFVATCRNGRVVNANPPWGLHQLDRG
jgi:carboxypeptidase family protein